MPVNVPPPAVEAHAEARERAAESRMEEPELRVIDTPPPDTEMPTVPAGF